MANFMHKPRILFLYGSLRERSYSRLLAEESARVIEDFGAEVRFFNPLELPIYGSVPDTHPKVQELRELSLWSEGQVWSSPEMHGNITGIMKNQIDWIPLSIGALRPTQGRTLAVMQVSGGSPSFKCGQYASTASALDADDHHPEPVFRAQGFRAVRRGRSDETGPALRTGGGRDGGAGQVHPS